MTVALNRRRRAGPPPLLPSSALIVERDDGRYQIGLADDGPGFESRPFAHAVAARLMRTRHNAIWVVQ